VPALEADVSYARRDDGTYGYCVRATPGAENTGDISDGQDFSGGIKQGALAVSEVLPKARDGCAWAELYNAGGTDIELGGCYVTDDKSDADKWRMPDKTLKAGGYAVIYLSGEDGGDMRAPFTLGHSDTGVYLYDAGGNYVSGVTWDAGIAKGVSVVGNDTYSACPTKGEENSGQTFSDPVQKRMDSGDPVRISEVLLRNTYGLADSGGERCAWAEIHNTGDKSVSLSGYYLSDSDSDAFKWAFPDKAVGPDEYITVLLSGKDSKTGELHASFRLSDGESVYLTDISGMKTDEFVLPRDIKNDISVGRDETGAVQYYAKPTPGSANAEGSDDPVTGANRDGVYISEVCAGGSAKSRTGDWIELRNGADEQADITGYYLSDDADDLKKWSIPPMSVEANGYAVIEACADAAKPETAYFGVAPEGETIFLCDRQGNILDAFDTGTLRAGVTSGRAEGDAGMGRVFFDVPTRGAKNPDEHYTGYAQQPAFSETGLYHAASFTLEITSATPGTSIYYTTDGTVPTRESNMYTAPINVSGSMPVRAAAYAQGLLPSEVNTETYVFGAPHTLPVFCITGKPSDIKTVLDADTGKKPEYPVFVEYYEKDGTLGVSFPSGLRPKGRASLRLPQNSLKLSLRGDYGRKSVIYPFFGDGGAVEYTTLALRSGGQDGVDAKMRDPFFEAVSKGLDVDGVNTKPVVVYANGKYCGLTT
jgi:hypothetical protein